MVLKLYLLRHGESTGNLIRQFQSRLDTELTDKGIKQAENLRGKLDVPIVYHSPLKRASETAKIAFPYNAELIEVENLTEDDVGFFTGKLYPDLNQKELDIWKRVTDDPDYTGHGGESRRQLTERAINVMHLIVADMQKRSVVKCAVISHGGLLRSFLKGFMNLNNIKLGNCSPFLLEYDPKRDKWNFPEQ